MIWTFCLTRILRNNFLFESIMQPRSFLIQCKLTTHLFCVYGQFLPHYADGANYDADRLVNKTCGNPGYLQPCKAWFCSTTLQSIKRHHNSAIELPGTFEEFWERNSAPPASRTAKQLTCCSTPKTSSTSPHLSSPTTHLLEETTNKNCKTYFVIL